MGRLLFSISRQCQDNTWAIVYNSEMQPKGLTKDVEWDPFKLSISALCSKQETLPLKLELFVL